MGDDFAKLIFTLVIAGVVIYLLVLAIPFLAAGAALVWSGRQLHHQTLRYRFTTDTYVALATLGVVSLFLSALSVTSSGLH
ncbi:MAG: hypothetical protein ACREA0_15105, partial [bacterium]